MVSCEEQSTRSNVPDAPMAWPAGHFYSPIPSLSAVRRRQERIFSVPGSLPGIDLNETGQVETIRKIARFSAAQPFTDTKTGRHRFYFHNDYYSYGEALVYFGMLCRLRPKRVIEAGSGFTTALLLDSLDHIGAAETQCTSIEPFPEVLRSLLRPGDEARLRILPQELQDVEIGIFDELSAGDMFFIDSTHVSKVGSDVNRILFEILPRLQPGVYVHFHDIRYPFEYPEEWIYKGRCWNEAYLLRAFLQYNSAFRIECFNSFLGCFHRELLESEMPLFLKNPGTSLWLRKESCP